MLAFRETAADPRATVVVALPGASDTAVSFNHFLMHWNLIYSFRIRVVFKWLMRAFSGHLQPQELLILWDLILGYDSLEILALLAIIILSFRKESLMQVSTIESIEAVLADLSSIKVLPLIQLALSRD